MGCGAVWQDCHTPLKKTLSYADGPGFTDADLVDDASDLIRI
jgi:hypothetical protein